MADFNVHSDSVNVEQIMEQIRARIREKRGVDYTEQQIRDLAAVKLQKFLDPAGVRSDLLEQFRIAQPPYEPPELPNYAFEENTLFDSHRGPLRVIRRLLRPILKLFFNPNPLIQALHIQARLNTIAAEREAHREASRRGTESLYYELIHNLVLEITRLGIETKNLAMRVESLSGRLEFNERRARALESVVVYKPATEDVVAPGGPPSDMESRPPRAQAEQNLQGAQRAAGSPGPQGSPGAQGPQRPQGEGPGQRSRRRRRRRGRRSGPAAAVLGAPGTPSPEPARSEGPAESTEPSSSGSADGKRPDDTQ